MHWLKLGVTIQVQILFRPVSFLLSSGCWTKKFAENLYFSNKYFGMLAYIHLTYDMLNHEKLQIKVKFYTGLSTVNFGMIYGS